MSAKKRPTARDLAEPLRQAATSGDVKRVRDLLAQGADPDRRATGQPTALIEAAGAGHLEVVQELLAARADPSFAHGGKRGTTALLEAIRHWRVSVARALIAAGADVHHDWSGEGQTITYEAAKLCNELYREPDAGHDFADCLEMVRALLAAGGALNPHFLERAAGCGNLGLVRALLDSGVDINDLNAGAGSTALSVAVLNGHEETAVELIRLGADPWLASPVLGGPVLHEAVVSGWAGVVEAIIQSHADLNRRGDVAVGDALPTTIKEERDAKGRVVSTEYIVHDPPMARQATALIAAVRCGRQDMVERLVNGGADLEATDGDGFTPLAWALKLGREDIAAVLRSGGAREPGTTEGSAQHALIAAASAGDVAGVRSALAAGADPSRVHDLGKEQVTALMRAADGGQLTVVEELLKAGADPNVIGVQQDAIGLTPLLLAARHGHVEVVKRLLAAGAAPDIPQSSTTWLIVSRNARQRWAAARDDLAARHAAMISDPHCRGDSAIHEAAAAGHQDVVRVLLDAGVQPSTRGASGTVFEAAAGSGDRQTVETVLSAKSAKSGKRGKPGVSAATLVSAAGSGDQDTVRALLAAGADVNKATRSGETALRQAVAGRDTAMVKLLLEAGAKPGGGGTKSPMSELMMAAGEGDNDIMQMLIAAGADVNEQRGDGMTPLHHAVTFGHAETVKLLLDAGASTTLRDEERKTPLQAVRQVIAAWSGENRHPFVQLDLKAYRQIEAMLEVTKA
jgi:ankyrin repeat protein